MEREGGLDEEEDTDPRKKGGCAFFGGGFMFAQPRFKLLLIRRDGCDSTPACALLFVTGSFFPPSPHPSPRRNDVSGPGPQTHFLR